MTLKYETAKRPSLDSKIGFSIINHELIAVPGVGEGISLFNLRVPDRYTDDYLLSPEEQATKNELRARINLQNLDLKNNPEWAVNKDGTFEDNPVAADIYRLPGMEAWRRKQVPNAEALWILQHPLDSKLLTGDHIDDYSRDFFRYAIDSEAIRTRAEIMKAILQEKRFNDNEDVAWTSLACGASVPVVYALKDMPDLKGRVHLNLVDINEDALALSELLAQKEGLTDYETHSANLITDDLDDLLGAESSMIVDALGIFEYLPDQVAIRFLRRSFSLVKPGGSLIIANMLDTHPTLEFNQRGIGWPKIFPRSKTKIVELISRAGLPLDLVNGYLAEDGVYAVFEIKKPDSK